MRSTIFLGLLLSTALMTAGCSGATASPPDGGTDGSPSPGDGGCITPVEGAGCATSDFVCPSDAGDPCCLGYAWICQNGVWTKAGLGCACSVGQPFACGSSQLTCQSKSQFCVDQAGGIPVDDAGTVSHSYSCGSMPPDCAAYPTCACVTSHNPCSPTTVARCDESNGEVTVHCMGQ